MDKRKRWGNPDIMVRIAMYLCLLTLSWVQVKGEVNTTVADVVWEIPIPHAMSDYQPGDVAYLYNKDVKGFFLGDNEYGTRASFSTSKGYKVKLEASDDEKPGTFLITSFVETKEQWLQTCCNDANGAGDDIWVDRIAQTAYHWVVSRNGDYYRFENAERREAGREGDYLGAILNSGNTRLFLCSEEFYPDEEFGVDWFFVDPLEYDRVMAPYNAAVALKEEIDAAKEKYKDDIDLSGPEMVYCNTSSTLDELLQASEAVKQAILDYESSIYIECDGIAYHIISGTTVEVIPLLDGSHYSGNVVVPETVEYNGKTLTVVSIGYDAFNGCQELERIELPSSIKLISSYAFAGIPFTSVVLPSSVETIEDFAFEGSRIEDITIPASVTVLGSDGNEVFYQMNNLMNIYVEDGNPVYTSVDGVLFNKDKGSLVRCPLSRTGIYEIPSSITVNGQEITIGTIDVRAFQGCKLSGIVIPETIEKIGGYAFQWCFDMVTMQCLRTTPIPMSNEGQFNDVRATVYVPEGSYEAYMSAEMWKDRTIIEGEPIPDFEYEGIAYSAISRTTVEVISLLDGSQYSGNVVIPETVEYNGKTFVVVSIGTRAFADCKDLQSVSISSTVETIQSHAFDNSSLKSLALPASVKSIARGAFVSGSLSVIQCLGAEPAVCQDDWIVNDGVKIYVPNGSYEAYMSAEVWKDRNIVEGEPIPNFEADGIAYCVTGNTTVEVIPLLDGESRYVGYVVVPETVEYNGKTFVVTSIGDNAFRDCGELQSVSLPSTVETIQSWAFASNSLKSLVLPASVKSIGEGAFVWGELSIIQCLGAEPAVCQGDWIFNDGVKIYVPEGSYEAYMSAEVWKDRNIIEGEPIPDFELDGIAYRVTNSTTVEVIPLLDGSHYSGNVVVPETVEYNGKTFVVTSIGEYAFRDCGELQSVSLPSTVETIQTYAFYGTSLKSLVLPASVKSIARGAFVSGSLSVIQCLGAEPAVCQDDWIVNDGVKIYVPNGSYEAYMSAEVWKDRNIVEGEPIPNFEADGIAYCVTGNTTVEVIPLLDGESRYVGYVVVPETVEYNGKTFVVTSIGDNAFRDCGELQSVSLPSTVETIQSWAFASNSLKSLVLPASVKSIGEGAFVWGELSTIQCLGAEPAVCQSDYIFNDDVIIYVPEGSYDAYMSAEVWKDKNIIEGEPIPDFELDGIAYRVTNSTTVEVIPLLDGSHYSGNVVIPETVEYNGKTFVVTSIGMNAFYNCWDLQSVSLPSTVETIQSWAFASNSLKSLVLPASVKSIGEGAFVWGELSIIQCLGAEPAVCQGDWIFNDGVKIYVPEGSYEAYMSAEVWKDRNIIEGEPIPDFELDGIAYRVTNSTTVEVIPLLDGSHYSGDVVVPETVEYNGKTFVVTSIGYEAFWYCWTLQSVSLPSTVETIQSYAFYGTSLKSLVLPASVKSIGVGAFVSGSLSVVQCLGTEPAICKSDEIFNDDVTIYVPDGSYEAYMSAEVWKDKNIIEGEPIPDFELDGIAYRVTNSTTVEVIPLLDGSHYSGNVVIPETVDSNGKTFVVVSIGARAFADCRDLQSVSLPSTVERIYAEAFMGTSLKSLVLPASVKSINDEAFVWGNLSVIQCLGAEPAVCQSDWIFNDGVKIYVPDGSYEAYMSAEVWKDRIIIEGEPIPDFEYDGIAYSAISGTTVEVICLLDGESRYAGDVIIPETVEYNGKTFVVTSIGDEAFYYCRDLQSVSLPSTVETIQSDAFYGTSLKSLVLPASVKSIANGAFFDGSLSVIQCLGAEPAVCQDDWIFNDDVTICVPEGSYDAYMSAEVWKDRYIIESEPILDFELDGIAYRVINDTTVEVIPLLDGESLYSGDVVIPETVEYNGKIFVIAVIKNSAFRGCWDLQSVSLPSTVETIRSEAFYNTSLKSLVLPASVKLIANGAFARGNLSVIQCLGAKPAVCQSDYIFNDDVTIYVPKGSYDAYMSAEVWKDQNIIELESAEEFEYALSEGWNWISVNVRDNSVLNAETMLAGIGDAAEYMASRQNILVNDPEYGWTGGLADISYAEGYKLKMNADAVLSLYGTRLLAGMIPVTVRSGWNWIGYVPYSAQWVSAALADHEACEGDVVKGQDDFAIYSNGVWNNDFVMKPGQGYMYYSATEYDRYFCYAENALAVEAPARTVRQKNSYWEYDAHRYADNMALIAKVAGDEDGIYTVGAFVGDECRGSSVGNDMLFITVHGDGDAEQVSFRIMDTRTNVMYEARETVEFASLVGSMASPVVLTLGDVIEPTNVAATDADIAVLFDGNRLVVKGASGMRSVRVADTNGIELVKKTDVSEIDLSALPRGIYIVVVDNGATVITRKIVKK